MSDCVQSINVICRHVEDDDTYYADFSPRCDTGETIASITSATPNDATMTTASLAVLTVATTRTITVRDAQGNTTTTTYVIPANKGVSFRLYGGTTGAGCKIVTVKCVKSTGAITTVDCLVETHGVDV